jgi:predicted small metal-binding protein
MTMRVIECNICGEPLAAATDDELLGRLRSHMESVHGDTEFDEDEARRTIAGEAYDAGDS